MKKILYLFIALSILSCKKDSKIESQEKSVQTNSIEQKDIEKLAGGFSFTEGPAADTEGNVYFTDIPENKIYVWTTEDKLETFREHTGGANGLFFDKEGNLLVCEGQKGQLISISPEESDLIVATKYNGKRFNQPNDVWADGKGGAYFTDPKYNGNLELTQGSMQVYYVNSSRDEVKRVTEDLVKPNGLIGTPDGETLYITDPGAGKTYKYNIQKDGTLADKTLFADVGGDGMTIDDEGNVYLTTDGKKAIDIFSKKGQLINSVNIPEQPANVCFGGKAKNHLFITARTSLYRVEVNKKGVR
jgi:gluconolactonase